MWWDIPMRPHSVSTTTKPHQSKVPHHVWARVKFGSRRCAKWKYIRNHIMRLSFVKVTNRVCELWRARYNDGTMIIIIMILWQGQNTPTDVRGKYKLCCINGRMHEWEALGGAARRRPAESAASAAEPERARPHPSAGPAPPESHRGCSLANMD